MAPNFKPITITGLDDGKSYNPDESLKLYNMYLILSSIPPAEWENIFDNIWQRTFYSIKRKAWIEDQHIGIYCVPEEIEKHHLDQLKKTLVECNNEYLRYLNEEKRLKKEKELKVQREKEHIKSVKDRLKFD